MTGRRVVITGAGALSALGDSTDDLWQGLLDDRSGIRRLSRFADMGLEVSTGGEIDTVPMGDQRDLDMARRSIADALDNAALDASSCGLIWGLGLDTFQLTDGQLKLHSAGHCFASLARPFSGPRRMMAVACATGTQALGEAFDLVRRGVVDACVAGGSSVMLSPFYLIGFARLGALAMDRDGDDPAAACQPFDRRRRGFALADGSGAVVIEARDHARTRGAEALAEVVGFGTSQDAFDLNRPPPDGGGAVLAMRRAVADAGLEPSDVDAINTHGTGTLAGDNAESAAIRALLGDRWKTTPVSSAKGAIGHAQAAAGALEAIVACRTCASGWVPPTVNLRKPDPDCDLDHVIAEPRDTGARTALSVSLGMGGQNAALLVTRAN